MLDMAYYGGLRVSELVSSSGARSSGAIAGRRSWKLSVKAQDSPGTAPAEISTRLFSSRGDAPASAPVFRVVRRPGEALTERAVNFIVKAAAKRAGVNPAVSVHWLRHAHASHAIDNGAPITLVSATLGHADSRRPRSLPTPGRRKLRPLSQDQMMGAAPTLASSRVAGLGQLRLRLPNLRRSSAFSSPTAAMTSISPISSMSP